MGREEKGALSEGLISKMEEGKRGAAVEGKRKSVERNFGPDVCVCATRLSSSSSSSGNLFKPRNEFWCSK